VFSGTTVQSAPPATVTNPSNRITATAGQSSVPPSDKAQIYSDGIQAGLQGIVLFTVILASLMLVSKLKRIHK
jgi:hypothetical protein